MEILLHNINWNQLFVTAPLMFFMGLLTNAYLLKRRKSRNRKKYEGLIGEYVDIRDENTHAIALLQYKEMDLLNIQVTTIRNRRDGSKLSDENNEIFTGEIKMDTDLGGRCTWHYVFPKGLSFESGTKEFIWNPSSNSIRLIGDGVKYGEQIFHKKNEKVNEKDY